MLHLIVNTIFICFFLSDLFSVNVALALELCIFPCFLSLLSLSFLIQVCYFSQKNFFFVTREKLSSAHKTFV